MGDLRATFGWLSPKPDGRRGHAGPGDAKTLPFNVDFSLDTALDWRMRSTGVEPTRFGELLRHYRSAGGLSQEYLAERARLSREAVSALERGMRRAPYRVTVELLADALGLSGDQRAEL
jgi:DNA-binding XRE family transcriptional regulator